MIKFLTPPFYAVKRRNTTVFTVLMTAAVSSGFANTLNLDKGIVKEHTFKNTGIYSNQLKFNTKQTTIRGKVVDKDNNALAGVNISVVGSKESTLSAADGSFTIKGN